MNTTTSAPQRPASTRAGITDSLRLTGRTPRTSPIDRIAMRIALGLLLWSSRPHRGPATAHAADHHRRREALLEREQRERAWLQQRHFTHHR